MIKILFLDTSALLSFFISDKGTPAMRWLISSDNKAHKDTRYIINNQVVNEFEACLAKLTASNDIKQSTADNILTLFNNHYKNQKFKLSGKDASVKDTLDGMYHFIGRLSRPVLVTSNQERAINCAEYKVINPHQQDSTTINLLLQGRRKPSTHKPSNRKPSGNTDNPGLLQRFFRKKRMAFTL